MEHLQQVDGEFTTAKGKEEMARLLDQYEDIDVVVSQNDDMTFGALEAIREAGKTAGVDGDITVISFDAVDAGVELVRNGEINIDVQCNPDQGKYVEQIIQDMEDGKEIEKTPNGGKAFGEILNPNLTGVMRITTRGNWYDRCYYDRAPETHANQFPYLSVNRRTNMASLLSEGGYHTIASQQQLNINADYKRLEAFAAFQSILKFRNMTNPEQTFLAGIIKNSENDVPIDGVTVKVGDKTYVTDTWESTFKKYTNNPDLIHNGFYLFEGLKAGDAVSVEFTATGYEPVTKTVVIKSNPAGQSNDNVTWLDIMMTSNAPAKVASISVEDTKAVSLVDPIVITFSRKMDKESVEKAFSIDNDGEVTLTWINDYTLSVDVSKLVPLKTYNIKIDGSVAKNSQTNQPFDGNGDGNGGDDYTLSITMKEADTTPAQVVSTDPAIDGDVAYTLRPVVRVEYDEIIDWNEDKNADCMTVIDPEGNTYAGTLTHSVVNGASVLQYFFSEDLPLDKCFLVTVKPGLADLSGNLTEEFRFRFLSEYRPVVESTDLLPLDNVTGFWAPDGSGSSSGLTQEANSFTRANIGVRPESPNSACLKYDFDPDFAAGVWQIREYHSSQNIDGTTKDGVLTFWLYGDGSNNSVSAALRVRTNNKNGGIKYNLKRSTIADGISCHGTWQAMNTSTSPAPMKSPTSGVSTASS